MKCRRFTFSRATKQTYVRRARCSHKGNKFPARFKAAEQNYKMLWTAEDINESVKEMLWEEEMREWDEWEKIETRIEWGMDMRALGWN